VEAATATSHTEGVSLVPPLTETPCSLTLHSCKNPNTIRIAFASGYRKQAKKTIPLKQQSRNPNCCRRRAFIYMQAQCVRLFLDWAFGPII